MNLIFLIIFFFSGFFSSFSLPADEPVVQKLRYVVIQDGKRIGEIAAHRTTQGDITIYEVETQMNIKLVFTQKVNYTSHAIYKNGYLSTSTAVSYVNDKLHHSCLTAWKGSRYEIRKEKTVSTLSRKIDYSGVVLYFREPLHTTLIYSEMSGQDNSIRRTGNGLYTLTDGKSKKQNKYRYVGGILEQAHLDHALVDIEIKRVR